MKNLIYLIFFFSTAAFACFPTDGADIELIGKVIPAVYKDETRIAHYKALQLAETEALDIIRKSDLKKITKNQENDPPMIYLEEIEEVKNFNGIDPLVQGRAFYIENEEPIK